MMNKKGKIKNKDNDKEKVKLLKCPYCGKMKVTFHFHECKLSMKEYYGCSSCDNWCTKCAKGWEDGNPEW